MQIDVVASSHRKGCLYAIFQYNKKNTELTKED